MKNKSQLYGSLRGFGIVVALVGLLSLPTFAHAQRQEQAAKRMELKAIKTVADTQAVEVGDSIVMSCPKCKNSWVTVVEAPTKTGAKPDSRVEERHDCPGCEHKNVTVGHGKAKTDKVIHTCKMCGSEDAFCCVMKKGDKATLGMTKEKK